MKTNASLKSTDVTGSVILLGVLAMLCCIVMYPQSEHVVQNMKNLSTDDLYPGYRTASIKTKCYSIPYSREQLKKIEQGGDEGMKEFRRFLREKVEDDDLSLVVAPPRVIFGEKSSNVCLDFEDPAVESEPFETRVV